MRGTLHQTAQHRVACQCKAYVRHASSVRGDTAEYEALLHSDSVLDSVMAVCSTLRTAGTPTLRGNAQRRESRAPALCGAITALP